MAFTVTDTNSSAHKYDADDGEEYTIVLRDVYTTGSGLTAGAGAAGDLSPLVKPRHVWIVALVGTKIKRRKVAISKAKADTLVAGASFGTADGITWNVAGYVGEKRRVKRIAPGASQ